MQRKEAQLKIIQTNATKSPMPQRRHRKVLAISGFTAPADCGIRLCLALSGKMAFAMASTVSPASSISRLEIVAIKHKVVRRKNHHRPKKTCPADKRHGPAVYPNLQNLPPAPQEYAVVKKAAQ
eukprot:jgi/Mesvir1/24994/Mv16952-RA.1